MDRPARGGTVAAAARWGLVLLALAGGAAVAQTPGETTAFASGRFRYEVALPNGCRHDQGPGTVDAICSMDFDLEKSSVANNATALVLGVAAEPVAVEGDTSVAGLQQRFGEAAFKSELPEAVCGESDEARVRIENVKETVENARLVYNADIVCAAVKFLQIGERRAQVRYVIAPGVRYRLVARAPAEEFEQQRGTIAAFFASFRVLPPEK
jgi:hypothetical protein